MPRPRALRSASPRLLALVVGLSVLGVVGYLVVSGVLGRGAAGAGTPEEAVKSFVTALQSKDLAAIAAALDPQEERQLVALVTQAQETTEQAGVTQKGQKGQELAGFDVKITNVTYDTKNLSERVARVDITGGKISIAGVDKSKLPLALQGFTVDPSTSSWDLGKLIPSSSGNDLRPFVMVVKEDRGWFISPLFTGAELLAQQQGVLGSYPDALPTATTEKTADDAVKQFLEAAASKDPDAVLARLTPQEQSVLRTYERVWRPSLNEAMATEAWNATNLQVSVNKMTDTDLGDGSTGVAVESADLSVSNNDGSGKYSLEKDCVQNARNGAECLESLRFFNGRNSNDDNSIRQGGTPARVTMVAVKTGEGYAVSLLGSAAVTGRSAVASLDSKEAFRAFGLEFVLPTGSALGVGQQVTVDGPTTDNVTLTVAKKEGIVLKAEGIDANGDPMTFYPRLWSAGGREVYSNWNGADGTDSEDFYSVQPGQFRITWSKRSLPDNGKITISARAQ